MEGNKGKGLDKPRHWRLLEPAPPLGYSSALVLGQPTARLSGRCTSGKSTLIQPFHAIPRGIELPRLQKEAIVDTSQ